MMDIKIIRRGHVFKKKPLSGTAQKNIDNAIDNKINEMAVYSKQLAPVLHYVLAPDIEFSPDHIGNMHYIYGSYLPYSRRWEYEHRSKSGYFRKSVSKHAPLLADDIVKAIQEGVEKHARTV